MQNAVTLYRVFLRSLRFWGPFTYVLSIGFPVLLFFFLLMNLGPQAHQRMAFLLSATMLVGCISVSVTSVGQYLVQLRLSGGFVVFQSLPIEGLSLILGIVLYYSVIQLPIFLVFMVLMPAFGFTRFLNPYFFLSILVGIGTLIPCGAFVGLYARSIQQGSVLSLAISFLLYMCAPVYFPLASLPPVLQEIARAIPTTYLADNLRHSVVGDVVPSHFMANTAIAVGYGVVLYALMFHRLKMVEDE